MDRAQMEVMGLVIIIILMTLGLLLVVKFVVMKPPSDIRQIQTDSQLAANFLNSLLQSTTTCNHREMRFLVQNCAGANDIYCPTADGPKAACDYVNRTFFSIVNQTLIPWSKSFNLTVSNIETNFESGISFSNGDCTGAREAKSYILPAPGDDVVIDLMICRESTI